jgi:mono/diheme cytochrome c family protein
MKHFSLQNVRRLILSGLLVFPLATAGGVWAADPSQAPAADVATAAAKTPALGKVDFVHEVQPILSDHCYACHAAETAEGGLRWDRKTALLGGDSGEPVLVPGKPQQSRLVHLVRDGGDEQMPPEGEGQPLNEQQIDLLVRWIEQGAPWPDEAQAAADKLTHWAFLPPQKHPNPGVQQTHWPRNYIDHFILARLEQQGLHPAPEADRYTLARRLFLDLTGIPPTPEEVDRFVNDTQPGAYERMVETLLASPHYGERWARMWLDLARYADTQGYEKDARRTIYSFRDWVIKAFNRDMPFDQFTIEQIAGDILPDPTTDQLVATAFHRNTMTNTEGGTDDEEFRTAAVVDRVNTTGQVWMGLTVGCAQCHTHKYDPITQREYYQLYAFLNQTEDSDKPGEMPTLEVLPPESRGPVETLMKELTQLENQLQADTPPLEAAETEWAEKLAEKGPPAVPIYGPWYSVGPFETSDFNASFAERFGPETEVDLEAEYQEGKLKWVQREEYKDGKVHPLSGDYAATYLYRTVEAEEAGPVEFYFGSDDGIKVWLNGQSIHENKIGRSALPDQDRVRATLRTGENHLLAKIANGGGKSGFFFRARLGALPESLLAAAKIPTAERTKAQQEQISSYYRKISPLLKPVHDEIFRVETELRKTRDLARAPTVPIMRELPAYQRRDTHVMIRGSFLDKGPKVDAAVPAALHSLPSDAPRNRLGLAYWLIDRDNPLTARVTANRFWEKIFGRGLVETSEDFGTQGQPPSHPQLLDRMASEFMDGGWSMKDLIRQIVTSATYRQSSRVDQEMLAQDADNRLLSRGPRFRLEAEMVRDVALATSGLLSEKMYGKSVMPPQPPGVWQVVYSSDKWMTSRGEDRYRRGLYTFWRRTSPYPAMMAFDATSRELCTVRRIRTNTPLAALVTLNDPAFVEAAQALAQLTLTEGGTDLANQITYIFRRCLARMPRSEERQRIAELYHAALAHYRQQPAAARKMAGTAEGSADVEQESHNAKVLAAWTVIGNMLLNLDETLTKG